MGWFTRDSYDDEWLARYAAEIEEDRKRAAERREDAINRWTKDSPKVLDNREALRAQDDFTHEYNRLKKAGYQIEMKLGPAYDQRSLRGEKYEITVKRAKDKRDAIVVRQRLFFDDYKPKAETYKEIKAALLEAVRELDNQWAVNK